MHDDKETLPLVEEELVVGTQTVTDGRVRVSTHTETIRDFADVELGGSEVDLERVPFGTVVETVPQVRIEGDVTIVPILEERLVVEKRLVLVEEILDYPANHLPYRTRRGRSAQAVSVGRAHRR
ncbi:YsnF/AvaK domain-containing protein (plasmid) [Rhizobium ruizarguesonis]|uniref:YsnF/AvaK domain-containing protein n=1 Tax=Rhizobium ruizarguesonis TaxID=2081791 RepID=A0ACD5EWZ6_9HYPH